MDLAVRVDEHRLLAAAQGALAGTTGEVSVEVSLHTSSAEAYAQLVESVAAAFGETFLAGEARRGRYVRFTPTTGQAYPSLTIHYYEENPDGE